MQEEKGGGETNPASFKAEEKRAQAAPNKMLPQAANKMLGQPQDKGVHWPPEIRRMRRR